MKYEIWKYYALLTSTRMCGVNRLKHKTTCDTCQNQMNEIITWLVPNIQQISILYCIAFIYFIYISTCKAGALFRMVSHPIVYIKNSKDFNYLSLYMCMYRIWWEIDCFFGCKCIAIESWAFLIIIPTSEEFPLCIYSN